MNYKNIDFFIILIYILLIFWGWININSTVIDDFEGGSFFKQSTSNKQFIWIFISIILGLVIIMTKFQFFDVLSYVIYIFGILLLVLVLFFGKEISGAKSWIKLGAFSFQPVEFAKLSTSLALAKIVYENYTIKSIKNIIIKTLIIIFIVLSLVILQNDTGSAIVFIFLSLIIFRLGFNLFYLVLAMVLSLVSICTLIFNSTLVITFITFVLLMFFYLYPNLNKKLLRSVILSAVFLCITSGLTSSMFNNLLAPHQQKRINVVLNIEEEPSGTGYNVRQSLIAIGSGGAFGRGYNKGTQTKLNFVPEQRTDFIFSTIGEEWGFLGSFFTILLYVSLLIRIYLQSEKSRNYFVRTYGFCICSIFFAHFFINIGMVIGILPVIGIPLPFISYGGSSMLIFSIMLFVFVSLKSKESLFVDKN